MSFDLLQAAAYGGEDWSSRTRSHAEEIGSVWRACGIDSEWARLKAVLLHEPSAEWEQINDPNLVQMLHQPNLNLARQQHRAIAHAYRSAGVEVDYVAPNEIPSPNLIFCADLFFMTPEGAILARPASTVRAGEERWIARRLADLGIPIVRTLNGNATFEGADALWLNPERVLLGHGLRTNAAGIEQVADVLQTMGVRTIPVELPYGGMHLMGQLRFVDENLAIAWPYRVSYPTVAALRAHGFEVVFIPDETEATQGHALNIVTLGRREILMPAGNPITQAFFESHNIICHTIEITELIKAAGGIGCLTGILARERSERIG